MSLKVLVVPSTSPKLSRIRGRSKTTVRTLAHLRSDIVNQDLKFESFSLLRKVGANTPLPSAVGVAHGATLGDPLAQYDHLLVVILNGDSIVSINKVERVPDEPVRAPARDEDLLGSSDLAGFEVDENEEEDDEVVGAEVVRQQGAGFLDDDYKDTERDVENPGEPI